MRRTALVLACVAALGVRSGRTARAYDVLHNRAEVHPTYSVFHDPDGSVNCKEFAFVYNVVPNPDTASDASPLRGLFHLVYQRSGGLNSSETRFGHAWSANLLDWSIDTSAFTVDTTAWNANHVWSPSIVEQNGRTYLFYTGVDAYEDQRIGYASTALLDTTDTVWDPARVMAWEAGDTQWAVPDPWIYSGQTQFRDAYVMHDPEHPGSLLMYYDAHDSVDFKLNQGGLVVGVARSDSGSVDTWHDLGYFPKTLKSVTKIGQLEGPHAFSADGTGTGWRLFFTNAGSPPGENGHTTIRFESLAAGESLADTTSSHWSAPVILEQYLNGVPTAFGWSGSEELHVPGADYLAGFTAWVPGATGIAMTRVIWNGSDFTLGAPTVTGVEEEDPPAGDVRMSLLGLAPGTRRLTFQIESPTALEAKLEVFDALGRRAATLLEGKLPAGRSTVPWELADRAGRRVASGVYFARLSFAGSARVVRVPVFR